MSPALPRPTRSAVVGPVLTIAGGVLMLLSFPPDWSTNGDASGDNPFHYPLTGGVAWSVVVAIGMLAVARRLHLVEAARVTPLVTVVAAVVATALVLIRVVAGARTVDVGGATVDLDRGPGMWLALVAALVTLIGATVSLLTARTPAPRTPPQPVGA